jgi:hypothetical protein
LFIHNFVLQAEKLSKDLLLPGGVKTLLIKVNQAALVSKDKKLTILKIMTPVLQQQGLPGTPHMGRDP